MSMKASASPARPSLWPLGLVTAFALFITGTGVLIWLSRQANLDLVRPDYYEAESAHDAEQARRQRAAALQPRLRVTVDAAARRLHLQMPPGHHNARGTITLYRPSAAAMDREFPLQPDASGAQELSLRDLAHGLWRLTILWTAAGEEYEETSEFVLAPGTHGTGP